MMKKLSHILRCYPLSCLLIAVIWVLCFCTPPSTPLDDVAYMDKWTHIVMYLGTCTVICIEYIRRHRHVRIAHMALWAWLAPIVMSGVIELLQAYCTGGRRSGEWMDFAANSTGATIGLAIGILLAMWRARGNRADDAGGSCRNDGRQ